MRCVDGDSELWRKSHLTLLCPPLLHWLDAELGAHGHGHHVEVEKAPPVRVRVGLEMQQEKNGFLKDPTNACTSSNYFYLRKKHCKHQLCAKEEVAHFVHFCPNEYSIWHHQPSPSTPKNGRKFGSVRLAGHCTSMRDFSPSIPAFATHTSTPPRSGWEEIQENMERISEVWLRSHCKQKRKS